MPAEKSQTPYTPGSNLAKLPPEKRKEVEQRRANLGKQIADNLNARAKAKTK
jgi:hypothetical protein